MTFKFEKCLRGQKKFIILETRNEGVRFTFSSLRQLSEEYLELLKSYNEVQGNLVEEVLRIAGNGHLRVSWVELTIPLFYNFNF